MSTDYRAIPDIDYEAIEKADFKVGEVHVRVVPAEDTKASRRCCLFDGKNYMWAYNAAGEEPGDAYSKTFFTRFGGNDVSDMLSAIGEHFGVEIISEHDENYWNEEES